MKKDVTHTHTQGYEENPGPASAWNNLSSRRRFLKQSGGAGIALTIAAGCLITPSKSAAEASGSGNGNYIPKEIHEYSVTVALPVGYTGTNLQNAADGYASCPSLTETNPPGQYDPPVDKQYAWSTITESHSVQINSVTNITPLYDSASTLMGYTADLTITVTITRTEINTD
jgi:hypothetical protein